MYITVFFLRFLFNSIPLAHTYFIFRNHIWSHKVWDNKLNDQPFYKFVCTCMQALDIHDCNSSWKRTECYRLQTVSMTTENLPSKHSLQKRLLAPRWPVVCSPNNLTGTKARAERINKQMKYKWFYNTLMKTLSALLPMMLVGQYCFLFSNSHYSQ